MPSGKQNVDELGRPAKRSLAAKAFAVFGLGTFVGLGLCGVHSEGLYKAGSVCFLVSIFGLAVTLVCWFVFGFPERRRG